MEKLSKEGGSEMFERDEQVLAKVRGHWVFATYLGSSGRVHFVEFFDERLMRLDVIETYRVRKIRP